MDEGDGREGEMGGKEKVFQVTVFIVSGVEAVIDGGRHHVRGDIVGAKERVRDTRKVSLTRRYYAKLEERLCIHIPVLLSADLQLK